MLVAEFLGHTDLCMAQAYILESQQEIDDLMAELWEDDTLSFRYSQGEEGEQGGADYCFYDGQPAYEPEGIAYSINNGCAQLEGKYVLQGIKSGWLQPLSIITTY